MLRNVIKTRKALCGEFKNISNSELNKNFKKIFTAKEIRCLYSSYVAGEPAGPEVKTQIPGPKSKELLGRLNQLQVSNIHNYSLDLPY